MPVLAAVLEKKYGIAGLNLNTGGGSLNKGNVDALEALVKTGIRYSGETAFYIGGPWQFAGFNATEGLNYGVAPVPYFEGGEPVVPTDSWAIAVSPYAAHPAEAKLFIEYASLNPEGALLSVANNPIPPVNEIAYKDYIKRIAGLDPEIGPAAEEIMTYELANHSVSRPRSVGYVAFEEILNRAFSDIRNGSDVKATLEAAQAQLTSTLARL
jgi:multiple sugar transport system substrate-binding protein